MNKNVLSVTLLLNEKKKKTVNILHIKLTINYNIYLNEIETNINKIYNTYMYPLSNLYR